MYRNVCRKESAWGPACYRLGLTHLKLGQTNPAAEAFRNAIGLLPPESPDHWDAAIKLSEIYIAYALSDKQAVAEVAEYIRQLLQRDPQSFDGHRLAGDLDYAQAYLQYQGGNREEWLKKLTAAIDEYRLADRARPGQQGTEMQLARALAAKGDLAGAEAMYRSVIATDEHFQAAYTESYRLLIAQNKFQEGENLLKEGARKNPKRLELLTMLAEHYLRQGRRDEMRGVIEEIGKHPGDFDHARLATGDVLLRADDKDAAIREYQEGAAEDAKDASAYLRRVRAVKLSQGKVVEAAEVNTRILNSDPKDSDARAMGAAFLLGKGETARATSELQAILSKTPNNATATFHLGQAYLKNGDTDLARKQFEETIRLRPTDFAARLALAELQLAAGDFNASLENARQAALRDRSNVEARLIAVAAYRGQRKFDEARRLLDSVLKVSPSSLDGLVQLGELNMAEKRFPEAEAAFRRAYALNPSDVRALRGIADSDLARNMPDKGIAVLQEAADKAPGRADLRLALAETAMSGEKYDIAIREFQKALPLMTPGSKERGDIYFAIGECYRRKGDLNGAIQLLQEARKGQPKHVGVASELAMVLDKAGRKPEAKEAYEAVLILDSGNAVTLNNLAYLLAETGGNLDDALSKAQHAKDLQPDMDAALDTMGWIYLKKDVVDTAARIFGGLVEKHKENPTYHYHLAVALSKKKDKSGAARELREALRLNPESGENEKIRELLRTLG